MNVQLTKNIPGIPDDKQKLVVTFDTVKELDIFQTLIGYYPYDTMEKLRKEFGNRFPNVTAQEVIAVVEEISKALQLK